MFLRAESDEPHDWGFSGNDGQRMPASHAERLGAALLDGMKDGVDQRAFDAADFQAAAIFGRRRFDQDDLRVRLRERLTELGEFMRDSGGFAVY